MKCALHWPSAMKAMTKPIVGHIVFTSPFNRCLRAALEGESQIVSSIQVLNVQRHPPHVARFVMAIVVNAVDRMCRRVARSDILKECLKGVQPSIAYSDSASSVIRERAVMRVDATLFHSIPRFVFGRPAVSAMPMASVCRMARPCGFTAVTSTRFNSRRSHKIADEYRSNSAAHASTDDSSALARNGSGLFDHGPSTELLSDHDDMRLSGHDEHIVPRSAA